MSAAYYGVAARRASDSDQRKSTGYVGAGRSGVDHTS